MFEPRLGSPRRHAALTPFLAFPRRSLDGCSRCGGVLLVAEPTPAVTLPAVAKGPSVAARPPPALAPLRASLNAQAAPRRSSAAVPAPPPPAPQRCEQTQEVTAPPFPGLACAPETEPVTHAGGLTHSEPATSPLLAPAPRAQQQPADAALAAAAAADSEEDCPAALPEHEHDEEQEEEEAAPPPRAANPPTPRAAKAATPIPKAPAPAAPPQQARRQSASAPVATDAPRSTRAAGTLPATFSYVSHDPYWKRTYEKLGRPMPDAAPLAAAAAAAAAPARKQAAPGDAAKKQGRAAAAAATAGRPSRQRGALAAPDDANFFTACDPYWSKVYAQLGGLPPPPPPKRKAPTAAQPGVAKAPASKRPKKAAPDCDFFTLADPHWRKVYAKLDRIQGDKLLKAPAAAKQPAAAAQRQEEEEEEAVFEDEVHDDAPEEEEEQEDAPPAGAAVQQDDDEEDCGDVVATQFPGTQAPATQQPFDEEQLMVSSMFADNTTGGHGYVYGYDTANDIAFFRGHAVHL